MAEFSTTAAGHRASAVVVLSNGPRLEKLPQIDDLNDVIPSRTLAHMSIMILIVGSRVHTDRTGDTPASQSREDTYPY
jgi:hypothetical protein